MFLRRKRFSWAIVACLMLGQGGTSEAAPERTITVFAAASMRNALDAVHVAFTRRSGIRIVASYAATSALAKQIEAGAPADVFVAADLRWMDYVAERKLIKPETRVNLLGNRLVLIAPKASPLESVPIKPGFDIARLAGAGRIAVANVTAVPAGRYAKAALTALGAWAAAQPKLAQADNVRAALAYVGRGEAPLGIVYASDAKVEPNVKVVGTFPAGSHPPITYPVAATAATAKAWIAEYLAFLRGPAAKTIFERDGFVPVQPAS